MKQYRIALLKKEFPFLDHIFDDSNEGVLKPEHVNEIKIRRGDNALLANKGYEDSYSWCDGGHYDYRKYFAIVGENIIELMSAGKSGTGSGERNEWDADSIAEQLFLKNLAPEYIVECVKNDTDDNSNGEISHYWTIHKMSKFDLSAYHQKKIDEAAASLKAEIALVCGL